MYAFWMFWGWHVPEFPWLDSVLTNTLVSVWREDGQLQLQGPEDTVFLGYAFWDRILCPCYHLEYKIYLSYIQFNL
jgi:hypothetical protein